MKKFLVPLLSIFMLLNMNTITLASSDVKIKVNGTQLSDAQAILKDGSTLLPVRSVSTALGGEVVWDNATKTASIDKDDTSVTITIGQKEITVNGQKQAISTSAQIISGRTYVPLRALGEALECDITWVNATKTVEISQVDPSEYKAWYEVDESGNLNIRTNINSQKWGGYSIVFRHIFTDNSYSWDSQSGEGMVNYYSSSVTSSHETDAVIKKTEFYVLKGKDSRDRFWDLRRSLRDHNKAFSALGDDLVCQLNLDNRISIKKLEEPIQLTDFKITYDKANQQETYTATIAGDIAKTGEYGLSYDSSGKNSNARLSYLRKGDGVLTFTREMHHFDAPGSSGKFYITYGTHIMNPDGSIICYKTESNSVPHKFPLYY